MRTVEPLLLVQSAVTLLGDGTLFALRTLTGLLTRQIYLRALLPICYEVGIHSVFVVGITGMFIGMVLAVQTYGSFHQLGLDSWLGSMINKSVVKELGPVLAAVMLAGRVGSAMAAELGTMRVTEQIDALACLGVNPVHYLVVPRFLACVIMVPLLTVIADVMGILGGAVVSLQVYHIDPHYYWSHSKGFVEGWDVLCGLIKPFFFGAALALISCHRGFHSGAGAEGVGRAATEAFVLSFIAILAIDFVLGLWFNWLYVQLWPGYVARP